MSGKYLYDRGGVQICPTKDRECGNHIDYLCTKCPKRDGVREELTDKEILDIAHRAATEYKHLEARVRYQFSDSHVIEFVRKVVDLDRKSRGG